MTTITIDTPLNIKKTHFATARDAAQFLLNYAEKEEKKWIKNESSTQYQTAISDLTQNKNVITLSEYMTKRWLTK